MSDTNTYSTSNYFSLLLNYATVAPWHFAFRVSMWFIISVTVLRIFDKILARRECMKSGVDYSLVEQAVKAKAHKITSNGDKIRQIIEQGA